MRHAVEKAKKIYEEIAADDKCLAEDFLGICAALPEYKISGKTGCTAGWD